MLTCVRGQQYAFGHLANAEVCGALAGTRLLGLGLGLGTWLHLVGSPGFREVLSYHFPFLEAEHWDEKP